jgi:thymidylate synthase ThyX
MKVTQVSLCPTAAAQAQGRPALTPELLAATGARYSRNNGGLEPILAKIDPNDLDKSVESIFRMVDYGHQSIADMAPVALFMDGLSLWLAYTIWSLCPLAGGQESSTRYIRLNRAGLPAAQELGVTPDHARPWREAMQCAFAAYEEALGFWQNYADVHPEALRLPASLLQDPSEKAQKQVARMRRNYAFDRARYFLPAAVRTNVMMVQSARAWVTLCAQLLSHPLPEANRLGRLITEELQLVTPRLVKYATERPSNRQELAQTLSLWKEVVPMSDLGEEAPPTPELEYLEAPGSHDYAASLAYHDNRYASVGAPLARMMVRFSWAAVAFGDIRDLNRHRSGTKWCPLAPVGFYGAADQARPEEQDALAALATKVAPLLNEQRRLLIDENWTFVYWILLGTQFPFEHTTTADKFLYEAELRTGLGAHYRYAEHLRAALGLWYHQFPQTRGLVLEGSAEPE